jgi:hypothetical protein
MKKRIADIAEVHSGYQFREKVEHDPQGKVAVIQIKDLTTDFQLNCADLVRISPPKSAPFRVEKGDVLFLTRGHRLGAVAVTDSPGETIATSYFLILRPSAAITPGFLAWSINQPGFQARMRPMVRGSHIPLITKAEFEQLVIDVPPLTTQATIETLDSLRRHERHLIQTIEEKRTLLIDSLCQAAATGSHAKLHKKG